MFGRRIGTNRAAGDAQFMMDPLRVGAPVLGDGAGDDLFGGSDLRAREDARMREVAQDFEAVFVTEMLKAAKIGESQGSFTGGHGEQAFVSLLQREYAYALTEQNAFGLAEQIYTQLRRRADANAE